MKMAGLAPIVLFVFRRPEHTARVLESLARNAELEHSELIIYCEGARNDGEREAVAATRSVVRQHAHAASVRIIERDQNLGCAASILAGINDVLGTHDRIIVLEDDLIVSRYFLEYMNAALERYASNRSVLHVSGYMFPNAFAEPNGAKFLPIISSWGWGTWRRAWRYFDGDLTALAWLDRSVLRKFRFDVYGAYPYREMIDQYRRGEIDAWDIRWYLGFFRQSGVAVFPTQSLVANIGFDNTGTHIMDRAFTEPDILVTNRRVSGWPRLKHSHLMSTYKLSLILGPARPWSRRFRTLCRELVLKWSK